MRDNLATRRLWLLGFLLSLALLGVAYRLVDLQVLQHEKLTEEKHKFTHRTILREPRRGEIRDIRGNLLATSRFVKTVFADPSLIGTNQAVIARAIAPLLGWDEAELYHRLQPRLMTNRLGEVRLDQHVVLRRRVEAETWAQIQNVMKELSFGVDEAALPRSQRVSYSRLRESAISAEPWEDQVRVYPNGRQAAHVLGFVGTTERKTPQGAVTETHGRDGVERTLNSLLSGAVGWRMTETDLKKREMVPFRTQDIAPRSGLNVVLTLDAGIQDIVESELAEAVQRHSPVSATALVIRPSTGDVLALANLPNFDPNEPGRSPLDHLRNRAITDMVEPGSTFKIVAVSGALNDEIIGLHDSFDCEQGRFIFAGKPLRDHHAYGVLSVQSILAKSSNIGTAKIGIRLGPERLWQHIRNYGFGEATGIPLPGEARGVVHATSRWSKLSISRIPIGHEVMVTPIQMVMAMSALANRGRLVQPRLVDRLEDEHGGTVAQYPTRFVRQVVKEEAVLQTITALKQVVTTNGTASRARMTHYAAAGKTGTAEKYKPGNYYLASFVGFFPADNPAVCIGIFLDEPRGDHTGGLVAAPLFRAMAERIARYLSIPLESPAETSLRVEGPAVGLTPKRAPALASRALPRP